MAKAKWPHFRATPTPWDQWDKGQAMASTGPWKLVINDSAECH